MTKHLAANTIEPKFATPERQSKIDPFADKLAVWLKTDAGKSRKQKRIIWLRTSEGSQRSKVTAEIRRLGALRSQASLDPCPYRIS